MRRIEQGPVEEAPYDQAVDYVLEKLGGHPGKLAQQFVAQQFVPLGEISIAVYRAEQLDRRKLALDSELPADANHLLVIKEVDIEREIIKPGFLWSCHFLIRN